MTSTRIVGLVRIGLVAASLVFAGGAAIGAGPVAKADADLYTRAGSRPTTITVQVNVTSGPTFSSRCGSLKKLAAGASAVGDPKQAHDFREEAMDLGCR